MLPDFASMTGRRLRGARHADVAAGVVCHQRSDSAFHDAPGFRALWLDGTRALRELGLGRGAARGAAHVGVELLLDGALTGERGFCDAYERALHAGAAPGLRAHLDWSHDDGDSRWLRLQGRLAEQGVPTAYRDPTRVAERVARALASRPRLALGRGDHEPLAHWLARVQDRVASEAPALLEQVRAGLRGA